MQCNFQQVTFQYVIEITKIELLQKKGLIKPIVWVSGSKKGKWQEIEFRI